VRLDISIEVDILISVDIKEGEETRMTDEVTGCCSPLDAPSLSEQDAVATAALFRALADPTRVKIVNLLVNADQAVCPCELEPTLRLSQPTVSHHLKKLTEAGLLDREQRGRWAYFSINIEALAQLARLVPTMEVVT
jgi:ArsR family transcriptional regulator